MNRQGLKFLSSFSVAMALSDESKKEKPKEKLQNLIKPSKLSLYEQPQDIYSYEYFGKEKSKLEEGVSVARTELQSVFDATSEARESVRNIYETGKAHSLATADYVLDENNVPAKVGAIATAGVLSLLIGGRKKGFIKKLFYGSLGATGTAALVYPKESSQIGRELYDNAGDYSTVAYNFIAGVKPQNENQAPPSSSQEQKTKSTPPPPPPPSEVSTQPSSQWYHRSLPHLLRQSSDVTLWGFRLFDKKDAMTSRSLFSSDSEKDTVHSLDHHSKNNDSVSQYKSTTSITQNKSNNSNSQYKTCDSMTRFESNELVIQNKADDCVTQNEARDSFSQYKIIDSVIQNDLNNSVNQCKKGYVKSESKDSINSCNELRDSFKQTNNDSVSFLSKPKEFKADESFNSQVKGNKLNIIENGESDTECNSFKRKPENLDSNSATDNVSLSDSSNLDVNNLYSDMRTKDISSNSTSVNTSPNGKTNITVSKSDLDIVSTNAIVPNSGSNISPISVSDHESTKSVSDHESPNSVSDKKSPDLKSNLAGSNSVSDNLSSKKTNSDSGEFIEDLSDVLIDSVLNLKIFGIQEEVNSDAESKFTNLDSGQPDSVPVKGSTLKGTEAPKEPVNQLGSSGGLIENFADTLIDSMLNIRIVGVEENSDSVNDSERKSSKSESQNDSSSSEFELYNKSSEQQEELRNESYDQSEFTSKKSEETELFSNDFEDKKVLTKLPSLRQKIKSFFMFKKEKKDDEEKDIDEMNQKFVSGEKDSAVEVVDVSEKIEDSSASDSDLGPDDASESDGNVSYVPQRQATKDDKKHQNADLSTE